MENNFSLIKERVIYIADYKRISRKDFCDMIGVTTANFRGEAKKTPMNSDTIEKLLSLFPEISPRWLITGEPPMLINDKIVDNPRKADDSFEIIRNLSEANKNLSETNKKLAKINAQLVAKI